MGCIWNVGRLEKCGFIIQHNKQSPVVREALETEVFVEDEFSDVYGQLSVSFHVEKLRRGLWMLVGYPWCLQRIRAGQQQVWTQFVQDKAIF